MLECARSTILLSCVNSGTVMLVKDTRNNKLYGMKNIVNTDGEAIDALLEVRLRVGVGSGRL
jgi:hypothetical protein